ncbi:unnamed protein product [Caenorhabditis bovis]|uniref:YEATS domain-containing protein n=1 Tax=Caenorhabditis bovis TaxID=2654633 RepID=A0A8S1F8T3_9PELO|nr:unnamed protein product [Caenorhabditis bovis]
MSESNKIIEVLIGHESRKLEKLTPQGHTHRWTLFVRPANKEYRDFSDNRFISKVKFQIHESFPNPLRTIKEPPFAVSETGFASFSSTIVIYLNLWNQKSHKIQYELNLSLDEKGYHDEIQKLNIKADIPSFFADLMNKYCLKKKSKRKSSVVGDEKSSIPEKKSKRSESSRSSSKHSSEKRSSSKSSRSPKNSSSSSSSAPKNEDSSKHHNGGYKHPYGKVAPIKTNPKKKTESIQSSPASSRNDAKENVEELTKKIVNISDPKLLYKVSEVLLSSKSSKLSESSMSLSFDLSTLPSSDLISISKLLTTYGSP